MIDFNIPLSFDSSITYLKKVLEEKKFCGDGKFTKLCQKWIEKRILTPKALLTTSCTHALEMSAILADIKPNDEVIMPSFTFVSTANAFVMQGANIRFVDIEPETMNIDANLIENAITDKTKAIVPVHYAGVACDMESILKTAKKYNLFVIEDAAQGMLSTYKGKPLGTIGDFGCFSFHETKNFNMGEGGALLVSNKNFVDQAEIIWEKGTNRKQFFRGEVNKYTWIDKGSSYLPSELNAAMLYSQFKRAEEITNQRRRIWNIYYKGLKNLQSDGKINIPIIPEYAQHNGHIFFLKAHDYNERKRLIEFLLKNGIETVFHYLPLHSSPGGKHYGSFVGEDVYTTKESERLLRLPIYYDLKDSEAYYVIDKINQFYKK